MYVIDAGRHNAVDLENFFLVIDIFIAVIKVYIVHGIGGGWGGGGVFVHGYSVPDDFAINPSRQRIFNYT